MKHISLLLLFFSISLPLETKVVDSYNKDIAIEQFEEKYANDWFYRWNNHGTPHRVIGSKIPFVFDTQNEKLSE
jgi:hypothetical protein